jgi:hypothetical protein
LKNNQEVVKKGTVLFLENRTVPFLVQDNRRLSIHLDEVEYFKEGQLMTAKANWCEYCDQVFVNKS